MGYIDFDTFLTTYTYDVCLRATAAWIRAVDYALSSQNTNNRDESPRSAMALTRPPGHHATYHLQNGFCFFNFAAAAAIHAVDSAASNAPEGTNASPRKVSILDFDVHYGQGVTDIVKRHENIRYVSIHQTPAFPYEGEKLEVVGKYQNIMTIPMRPDTTWTCGYRDLYEKALEFCCNESWQPDLIIVCAGYDALASDHLASTSLISEDYGRMVRRLREHVGNQVAIMFGLEGGYQLTDAGPSGSLSDAVLETVKAMTWKFIEQDTSASK
jgi:acetoin utilization deacetylase AcuC-like enzyme